MTLIIRHAQSTWNVIFGAARIDAGLPDPGLTEEGRRQAETLAQSLEGEGLTRLISSPYRRTLETASIVAERLQIPITVDPLVRERCAFSCDQGSAPASLRAAWPQLDFAALPEVWWGGLIESMETLEARCATFRDKLARLPDRSRVAIVSHWGFIRGLTGLEVGNATWARLDPTTSDTARERSAT